MPFTTISALPPPPVRSDGAEDFTEKADDFLGAFPLLRSQINTVTTEISTAAALIAAAPVYADAGLVSIANLDIAANEMLYGTGANVFAKTALTAFARTMLDDADAAAVRTTLGLGSIASSNTVNDGNWSGTDLSVTNGGTGASTAANARTNLGAAASGANSDITSLTALSTALSVAQGGTGQTTLAALLAALITVTSDSAGICMALNIGGTTYKVQWGRITVLPNDSATVTFPEAFTTTSSIAVVCSGVGASDAGAQDNTPATRSYNATTATFYSSDETSATTHWIAIGY